MVSIFAHTIHAWIASAMTSSRSYRGMPSKPARGTRNTAAKKRPANRHARASLRPNHRNSFNSLRNHPGTFRLRLRIDERAPLLEVRFHPEPRNAILQPLRRRLVAQERVEPLRHAQRVVLLV